MPANHTPQPGYAVKIPAATYHELIRLAAAGAGFLSAISSEPQREDAARLADDIRAAIQKAIESQGVAI